MTIQYDVAQLWEDNAGGLYLVFGERLLAGMEQAIGDDARELLAEFFRERGDVEWDGFEEYSLALADGAALLAHSETRLIARYGLGGLEIVDRPGNAGRAFLGPYAPSKE